MSSIWRPFSQMKNLPENLPLVEKARGARFDFKRRQRDH